MKLETGFCGQYGCLMNSQRGEKLENLEESAVKELLDQHSVVAFRGYDVDLAKFKAFTERFSSKFLIHHNPAARPSALENDRSTTKALAGNDHVHLHGELYYLPNRPDMVWLYCIQPAEEGGETTVCSGRDLLNSLKPATRDLFERKKIRYIHTQSRQLWSESFSTESMDEAKKAIRAFGIEEIEEIEGGGLRFGYETSAFMSSPVGRNDLFINSIVQTVLKVKRYRVEFVDGSQIPLDVVNEIAEAGEKCAFGMKWRSGDILLVDNKRNLHGRRAFTGPREVITRFSLGA